MKVTVVFFLILGSILMTSCASETKNNTSNKNEASKSEVISMEGLKKEKIIRPGVGIGNLVIGKTTYDQLLTKDEDREKYQAEGFEFTFEKGKILKEIILKNTGDYLSVSGEKLGKSKNEIVAVMGEPVTSDLSLNKGETKIGQINSLNYEGVTFVLQDSLATLIVIAEKK
ncbi:MAG: hypothetical protein MK212_12255 [Saprospiraceae bacterium]|nr:hypothetical protein [Saprospiraceae bacterium]